MSSLNGKLWWATRLCLSSKWWWRRNPSCNQLWCPSSQLRKSASLVEWSTCWKTVLTSCRLNLSESATYARSRLFTYAISKNHRKRRLLKIILESNAGSAAALNSNPRLVVRISAASTSAKWESSTEILRGMWWVPLTLVRSAWRTRKSSIKKLDRSFAPLSSRCSSLCSASWLLAPWSLSQLQEWSAPMLEKQDDNWMKLSERIWFEWLFYQILY